MNEFEKDPNHKGSDVVDSIKGFTYSLVFFIMIFGVGVVISLID